MPDWVHAIQVAKEFSTQPWELELTGRRDSPSRRWWYINGLVLLHAEQIVQEETAKRAKQKG